MLANWKYFSYVARHKWFVFRAGLKIKAPIWRLLIHDYSKLYPSEWIPYTNYFYRDGGDAAHYKAGGRYDPSQGTVEFNIAWIKHQHKNPHHWQHWVLREDDGDTLALPMPKKFVKEMVADWMGAGQAQGHGNDVKPWYERNKDKMVLHSSTRELVESILETL